MDDKDRIDKMDFPSNSNSRKIPEVKNSENKDEKRLEKVITGNVVKQKKTLGKRISENFLGEDRKGIWDYILYDVLIPAAKDMLNDAGKGALEMMLYGVLKGGSNTTRNRGKSYVSYDKVSYREHDRRDERRDISSRGRAQHDFGEIILETRGEAEEVLSHLVDLTIDYNMATVADLYDLVGITPSFTDNKYGWLDLKNASVSRVRGGYLINLPRTQLLD